MKIPNKLKIGGHIIKVNLKDTLDGRNGEVVWTKNQINICRTLPQSQKESTLIHEMLHYINTSMCEKQFGHALQDSLSEQLYQVLSDNKLFR